MGELATYFNAPNVNTDPVATSDLNGVRHTVQCDSDGAATKITITKGGASDIDVTNSAALLALGANSGAFAVVQAGKATAVASAAFTTDCQNSHYYQFGFFSTGTPRWNRDLAQNNQDNGKTPKDEQVSLYGMKNHMQYQFNLGTLNMATDSFYGIARDTFTDLNSGMGSADVGYSITGPTNGVNLCIDPDGGTDCNAHNADLLTCTTTDGSTAREDASSNQCVFKAAAGTDNFPQPTASVIAGENGAGAYAHAKCVSTNGDGTCEPFAASEKYCEQISTGVNREDGDSNACTYVAAGSAVTLGNMMEHAEKYAYIGKGYDKLTVSPMPDSMTAKKVTITYTGPSAGCSVTEVDRGTHESSECSGRGNCDYTTGTCLCDAGYTLEACSEQTVLV